MSNYAQLEIALRRREANGYPIEMRFLGPGSNTDVRFPSDEKPAYANIDAVSLQSLSSSAYGAALGKAVFADNRIRQGLDRALGAIQDIEGGALRIRLYINAATDSDQLHGLHWETLCDADGNALFDGTKILFSRYLASSNAWDVGTRKDLKALIIVANPPGLANYSSEDDDPSGPATQPRLAPVDVPAECQRAQDGLTKAGVACSVLAQGQPGSLGPATSDQILVQLGKGYDIVYLVCHGGLLKTGKATLYLDDGIVDAENLVARIRNSQSQPRLMILASCQSAGEGTIAWGTLSALGPKLVDAGIPAVVAMQGKIKMATVDAFMPVFLAELGKENGEIDRAMGLARDCVRDHCLDYWMPVLFTRLLPPVCLWETPDDTTQPLSLEDELRKLRPKVGSEPGRINAALQRMSAQQVKDAVGLLTAVATTLQGKTGDLDNATLCGTASRVGKVLSGDSTDTFKVAEAAPFIPIVLGATECKTLDEKHQADLAALWKELSKRPPLNKWTRLAIAALVLGVVAVTYKLAPHTDEATKPFNDLFDSQVGNNWVCVPGPCPGPYDRDGGLEFRPAIQPGGPKYLILNAKNALGGNLYDRGEIHIYVRLEEPGANLTWILLAPDATGRLQQQKATAPGPGRFDDKLVTDPASGYSFNLRYVNMNPDNSGEFELRSKRIVDHDNSPEPVPDSFYLPDYRPDSELLVTCKLTPTNIGHTFEVSRPELGVKPARSLTRSSSPKSGGFWFKVPGPGAVLIRQFSFTPMPMD